MLTQGCSHARYRHTVPFIYLEFQAHGVVGRADLTLDKDESAHDEPAVVYIIYFLPITQNSEIRRQSRN